MVGGHSEVGSLIMDSGPNDSLVIDIGSLYSIWSETLKVGFMPRSGGNSSMYAFGPTFLMILKGPIPWICNFFRVLGGNRSG